MYKPFIVILFIATAASGIFAQTTAFNFQGRLNDGGNTANSNYDFQFKLFTALTGGNQVGLINNKPNLQVINGVFSAVLDFSASPFLEGENRFLEISVRPAGSSNAYVVLGARQQILAAPLAVRATSANFANFANIALSANDSNALGGIEAANFARLNTTNQGNFNINGSAQIGTSLTTSQLAVTQNAIVGGNATVNGNSSVGGSFTVSETSALNGNVVQPAGLNGTAKALLYVSGVNGVSILRCYNGVTGNAVSPCGFTVTQPLGAVGVYRINFGFPVNTRFVVATSEYSGSTTSAQNTVPQFKFLDSTTITIFLTKIESPADTTPFEFMVMVF